MKFCILGLIVLFVTSELASASFLDDMGGALTSFSNSVTKLFNDVITDVKVTIDCTILAVEHVLEIEGDREQEFQRECQGNSTKTKDQNNTNAESITNNSANFNSDNGQKSDEMKRKIEEDLCENLQHKAGHLDRLKNTKELLQSKNSHLSDVGVILQNELNKMSTEVKNKISKQSSANETANSENIYDDLIMLQSIEENDNNSTEVHEINQIFDEVASFLYSNSTEATLQKDNKTINKNLESETKILTEEGRLSQTAVQETTEISSKQSLNDDKEIPEIETVPSVSTEIITTCSPSLAENLSTQTVPIFSEKDKSAVDSTTKVTTTARTIKYTLTKGKSMESSLNIETTTISMTPGDNTPELNNLDNNSNINADNSLQDAALKDSTPSSALNKGNIIKILHSTDSPVSQFVEEQITTSSPLPPLETVLTVIPKNTKAHKIFIARAEKIIKKQKETEKIMENLFDNPNIKTKSVFDLYG